jgi:hypothetical protein
VGVTDRGNVSLVEVFELTALVALKDPKRRCGHAARWLSETLAATLEDAALVLRPSAWPGDHEETPTGGSKRSCKGVAKWPCVVTYGPTPHGSSADGLVAGFRPQAATGGERRAFLRSERSQVRFLPGAFDR